MMNAIEIMPHQCFDIETLAEYQLGKLEFDLIQRIDVEAYACPTCRHALESLDDISDATTEILAAMNYSTMRDSSVPSPTPDNALIATIEPADYQPRAFGPYDLIKPIGRGGMGTVWVARHRVLDRDVAIKLLPIQRLPCEKSQARFIKEITAHGRLSHENLVRAYDAGEIDGIPFLAMELLDGQDATRFCEPDRLLPIGVACELIRQAAAGIAHAHEKGSIHRDIKPSNLRVTADGVVKVLDMGLARLVDHQSTTDTTTANQVLGTIDYMAPEQFCDPAGVDSRGDIYSLGSTLYHLLSGYRPFENATQAGVIAAAVERHHRRPTKLRTHRREIPARLEHLVSQMLAGKPDHRPQSIETIIKQLEPFCVDQATLASFVNGSNKLVLDGPSTRVGWQGVFSDYRGRWSFVVLCGVSAILFFLLRDVSQTITVKAKPVAVADAPALANVISALEELEEHDELKSKLITAVRANPNAIDWLVDLPGGKRASMKLDRFPTGTSVVHLPGRIRIAKSLALLNLVRAEATRPLLAKIELDDPEAVDATIAKLNENSVVAARVNPDLVTAVRHQETVLGIVVAARSQIQAAFTTVPGRDSLREVYRSFIVQRYQTAIAQQDFETALADIGHLQQKPFVGPEEFIAAAKCFVALNDQTKAAEMLSNLLTMEHPRIDCDLLVEVGDMVLALGTPNCETLAENVYTKALAILQSPAGH